MDKEKRITPEQMTPDQLECHRLYKDLHFDGPIYHAGQNGIRCHVGYASLATFDFDKLTILVVLAHDRCIRVEIEACNHSHLRIFMHRRVREGTISQRHPTIEDAVKLVRRSFPQSTNRDNSTLCGD